jgi:hypothetical protein
LYAGRLKLGNGDGWRDCFIENRHRGLSTGCPQTPQYAAADFWSMAAGQYGMSGIIYPSLSGISARMALAAPGRTKLPLICAVSAAFAASSSASRRAYAFALAISSRSLFVV